MNLRSYAGEVRARDQVAVAAKISGRIEELRVRVGDRVKAGDVIAVLDHQTVDAQVKQAEADLATAEANLKKVEGGPRPEQVAIAQAALDSAKAKLDALMDGPTREEAAAAEAEVASAQAKLNQTLTGTPKEEIKVLEGQLELAKRDRIYQEAVADVNLNPFGGKLPTTYTYTVRGGVLETYDQKVQIASDQLEAKRAPPGPDKVAELKAAVDSAKAKLDKLTAKPKPSDIAQLQSAVNAAQAQLDLAKAPYTEYDLAVTRAAVTKAQAALQLARAQQAEAFLRSPVDGLVVSRDLGVGALPAAGSPVVTLVSQELEVVFSVEEKGLGLVAKGMPVLIITWGTQNSEIRGEVSSLAPAVKTSTRTFDVYVTVNPGSTLVPGMFVTVSLPEGRP